MYRKPDLTAYRADDLRDLMGPVETQYACDVDVQPNPVPVDSSATAVVDFSSMPDFDTVFFELPGTPYSDPITIARSQGGEKGTDWYYEGALTSDLRPGTYQLVVRLAAGSEISEPCSVQFSVVEN